MFSENVYNIDFSILFSHFYFGIDYALVWNVVKEKLPILKPQIERMLNELSGEVK